MHRARSFILFASIAGVLALPETAGAQDITASVRSFTGRSASDFSLQRLASSAGVPIGAHECDAVIEFRFNGVDVTRDQLIFYEGTMCDNPDTRLDETTSTCDPLAVPSEATENRSEVTVPIVASDLIPCDEGGSGTVTVWVLAVDADTDMVSGAGQKVSFPIAYDLDGPGDVSGFMASGGEVAAELTWTASGSVAEYEIFVDPSGCPSTALETDPPDESLIVATLDGGASEFSLPFPDSVPIGGQMAVGIRATDNSGNVGDLSDVECVDRFEVTSWFETYCGETGHEACDSSGCAATPTRSPMGPAFAILGVAALALYRRRTR